MLSSRLLNFSSRMPRAAAQLRNASLSRAFNHPGSMSMRLFSTDRHPLSSASSPINILRQPSRTGAGAQTQKMAFSTSPKIHSKPENTPPSQSKKEEPTSSSTSQFNLVGESPGSGFRSIMENMNPRAKIFLLTCLAIAATAESYFWCRMIYEKYFRPREPEVNEDDWWESISSSTSSGSKSA